MSSLYDVSCFAAGLAGNIFALALFLSPVPTFKRALKAKSTEQFDGLPYLFSLLNCCICLWYGLPWVSDGRLLVATVNGTGAVFQLAYISLFIFYADSRRTRMKITGLLVLIVFVFALIAHTSLAFFDHPVRQQFVGAVSMASLISMFASPLAVMGLVIRTECVEFMPFYLSLSTFLMSASFALCGLLLRDFFIYWRNWGGGRGYGPPNFSNLPVTEWTRSHPWSNAAGAVRVLQQEMERWRFICTVARLIKTESIGQLVVQWTRFRLKSVARWCFKGE